MESAQVGAVANELAVRSAAVSPGEYVTRIFEDRASRVCVKLKSFVYVTKPEHLDGDIGGSARLKL